MNDLRLNYLIIFLRKLRGMKYTLCLDEPMNNGPPLWNHNNKLPSYNVIYNSGSACVGLVNMIRRKQKLNIPALNKKFIGGTEQEFLNKKKLVSDSPRIYFDSTRLLCKLVG